MRIYKVFRTNEWSELESAGRTEGSADDRADGFVHLCTKEQIGGVMARHFQGESGLILAGCEADDLGDALTWEGGGEETYPHLYRELTRDDVIWHSEIPRDGVSGLKLGG